MWNVKISLQLASSGLLRLSSEEASNTEILNSRHSVYIILDQVSSFKVMVAYDFSRFD